MPPTRVSPISGAPTASALEAVRSNWHRLETPEAQAVIVLHEIAGLGQHLRNVYPKRRGLLSPIGHAATARARRCRAKRVGWGQTREREHLITALNMVKIAQRLHSHRGSDAVPGDRRVVDATADLRRESLLIGARIAATSGRQRRLTIAFRTRWLASMSGCATRQITPWT
jgi:hypothetical protein